MLYALNKRPLCVGGLAVLAGVSQSAVSHQLRLLRHQRLVKSERAGNVIHYSIATSHQEKLIQEAECDAGHVLHRIPDHG